MNKNIWIWNHYASNMYLNQSGRHYSFAKELINHGYNPTIFCASTVHNTNINIDTQGEEYYVTKKNGIRFVIIKTPDYNGNGKSRIYNMYSFYKSLYKISKIFKKKEIQPRLILASSVHPLTLVAGIKVSRKMSVPCICEVRDLWPESLIAYGIIKKGSILAKVLYMGEKWIYKNANAIIMTWAGGKQYIQDRGWEKLIPLNKVYHISNGVDLADFEQNNSEFSYKNTYKQYQDIKNIVYTGSIRKVNNLNILVDVAKEIQKLGRNDLHFQIYGTGDEECFLKKRCEIEEIKNISFNGHVDKKYIPSILKSATINILHNTSTCLDKYGQSQNKLYEYLAAGRPIIQTYSTSYNVIEETYSGLVIEKQNPQEIVKSILSIINNDEVITTMSNNAKNTSHHFDYKNLTKKLIEIIENTKGDL